MYFNDSKDDDTDENGDEGDEKSSDSKVVNDLNPGLVQLPPTASKEEQA